MRATRSDRRGTGAAGTAEPAARPRTQRGRHRSLSALAVLIVTALLLGGCSGDDAATEARLDGEGGDSGGQAAPAEDDAVDADDGAAGGADEAAGEPTGGDLLQVGAPLGRKVIRTADLELAVRDTEAAVAEVTALAERAGGFVSEAELYREPGDQLVGDLTLRVPTSRLTSTLTALEELATEVRSKRIGSDDVTEQYSDIEAQLRNLRALEVQLLDLLAEIRERSDSADEILRVFERIRQVRAEIETLEGRRQVLDDLVDLATIHLRLVPAAEAIPLADEGWAPGTAARDALRTTVTALQGLADAAIWVVLTALPLLLVLAVPVGAAVYALRRWRRAPAPRASD